jgi:hypothetical protein
MCSLALPPAGTGGTTRSGMHLFAMPRASNTGCRSMAYSSGDGGSMSEVAVAGVWEWNASGNGCRWHGMLGIRVVGWHP